MGSTPKDIAQALADEAELAEKDRDKRVRYTRAGRPPKPLAERGQVYSIRIPAERLEELRLVAAERGKPAAVLARDWILERLDRETDDGDRALRLTSRAEESRARYRTSGRRPGAQKRARTAQGAASRSGKRAKKRR